MNRPLRCQHCNDVIGMYEPMIVLADGDVRESSRTAEKDSPLAMGACYHRACYVEASDQDPDGE
jgi:hypothetical protein